MHERGHVLAVGRYRCEPRAVAQARRTAVEAYSPFPWIDSGVVALLVSELATNAVLHSNGADFYVLCHSPSLADGSVQVEVHDGGSALPAARMADALDEGGRGLELLGVLAAHWRTERTTTGKSLVFTLKGDR
ncbi:ATP-binding protein [Streptomyces johnsoniae]|uniref:ATP-binding protein n=1 Tax=Streptomyces johnsoniae TaxID=3075532 RepID=A0ABU2SGW9_9ACTN|nr:ATP-binding protein [Streptomyces sp. DSM 41886]MDT0447320.1 ATP-binding protein [Streptomyces sp. DSM 41886]